MARVFRIYQRAWRVGVCGSNSVPYIRCGTPGPIQCADAGRHSEAQEGGSEPFASRRPGGYERQPSAGQRGSPWSHRRLPPGRSGVFPCRCAFTTPTQREPGRWKPPRGRYPRRLHRTARRRVVVVVAAWEWVRTATGSSCGGRCPAGDQHRCTKAWGRGACRYRGGRRWFTTLRI